MDSAAVCHPAVVEEGLPVVIPTLYAGMNDEILVHGSRASSVLEAGQARSIVNLVVTLADAVVLPDNIFDRTIDYRTVSLAGPAYLIDLPLAKARAIGHLSRASLPGRYEAVHAPDAKELSQTSLIAVSVEQAVMKVSDTGLEDLDSWDTWTGKPLLCLRQATAIPSKSRKKDRTGVDAEQMASRILRLTGPTAWPPADGFDAWARRSLPAAHL